MINSMLEALRALKEENGEAEWKKVLDEVNKGNFIQVVLDSYEALFLGIIDDTFYAIIENERSVEKCPKAEMYEYFPKKSKYEK